MILCDLCNKEMMPGRVCVTCVLKYHGDAQYQALLSAFGRQEETMNKVAAALRRHKWPGYWEDAMYEWMDELADELDPREPIAEADAAEQFSQDCAKRRGK